MNTSTSTSTPLVCLSALLGLLSAACIDPFPLPHGDWSETSSGEGETDSSGDGDGDGDGETEVPAFPDPEATYLLKTEGRGAAWCLDSNDPTYDWNNGNTVMDRCNGSLGKQWRFEPVVLAGELSYRVTSEQHGGKCLQGNDPDTEVMNGSAFMADCAEGNPDQLWELLEWGGWYLLRTRFKGSGLCLDSNMSNFKDGTAYMSECEPRASQRFQLTTTAHYSPELCEPLGLSTGAPDGLDGQFCTFACETDEDCPQSNDGTAALCDLYANGTSYCGLYCNPLNDQCPTGATCQGLPGDPSNGLCLY